MMLNMLQQHQQQQHLTPKYTRKISLEIVDEVLKSKLKKKRFEQFILLKQETRVLTSGGHKGKASTGSEINRFNSK